jgi:hypothetical protein
MPSTSEGESAELRVVFLGVAASVFVIVALWLALPAFTGRPKLNASEQASYIDDNQRLLDSLPQIPGSERLDVQSNPYCSASSPTGYSTFEHHRTDKTMSHEEIVDFYVTNLGDGWQHTDDIALPAPYGTTGVDTEVEFRRGSETVWVSIIPVEGSWPAITILPPNAYSVGADSHRPGNLNCHNG